MHLTNPLLQTALFITLTLALPATHSLTKRHFWCNGVDSETICPQGETMVPIDSYACNAISAAGRLNQISPPVNGESSTTCPQAQNPAPQNPPPQNPPPQNPAPQNPAPQKEQVNQGKTTADKLGLESTSFSTSGEKMNLSCLNVGNGAGGAMMLNCTVAT